MYLLTERTAQCVITAGVALALVVSTTPSRAETSGGTAPSLNQAQRLIPSGPPSLTAAPSARSGKSALDAKVSEIINQANFYFRVAELAAGHEEKCEPSYAKAEELAEKALALDPNLAQAHFLLFAIRGRRVLADGVQVTEIWQFPKLNHHLTRALELDPDHAHALAARGGLLLDLPPLLGGDPDAALEYLQRAIALNPLGLGTRVMLARALLHRQEYGQAKQHLLTAAHYACRFGRREVVDQAEALLADLDSNAEASGTAQPESHSRPWEPRSAAAATSAPPTRP